MAQHYRKQWDINKSYREKVLIVIYKYIILNIASMDELWFNLSQNIFVVFKKEQNI